VSCYEENLSGSSISHLFSVDIVNLFVGAKPIAELERGKKLESKNYWGEW